MDNLFFFGTLRDDPLLQIVLGLDDSGREWDRVPASLPDYAVTWAKGQSFPMIAPQAGQQAEGVLVTGLSKDQIARLDFYEGGFDFDRIPLTVSTAQGPQPATVYLPAQGRWTQGEPWSLAEWQAQWGVMTRRAAQDVMAEFGHMSRAEMDFARPQILTRAASWARAQQERKPRNVGLPMTAAQVETKAIRRPYTKFFAIDEQDVSFANYDGAMSQTVTRAAFTSGDAVTVLPYDPVRDRVLLVEQFRFGPYVRGDQQPWSLEPIAGRIDPGEEPEQSAYREVREEAHLELSALHQIAAYYPSPGAVSEYLFSYIGLADLPDDAAVIGGLEDEAEDIRGVVISFDALMDLLTTGEAQNGPLIMSALWLARNRDQLRAG